jgi:hypothetical protein
MTRQSPVKANDLDRRDDGVDHGGRTVNLRVGEAGILTSGRAGNFGSPAIFSYSIDP